MKKFLVVCCFLLGISTNYAMLDVGFVKLPKIPVLKQRLESEGFTHFLLHTKILELFGVETFYVCRVIDAFDIALSDYNKKYPIMKVIMQARKYEFLRLVLRDSADALEELNEQLIAEKNFYDRHSTTVNAECPIVL